jgi:dolichyl-phosphate-mannose-protein mannosyltransferase
MSATKSKDGLVVESHHRGGRHASHLKPKSSKGLAEKRSDYGSDGVQDNNIFDLPVSDYQWVGFLTVLAAIVRLFRIYQPSSVVFDEVQ